MLNGDQLKRQLCGYSRSGRKEKKDTKKEEAH